MLSNMLIEITTECTRRCPICEASIGDRPVFRLPIGEGMEILSTLRSEGVTSFSFTGGEPLIYKEALVRFLGWASGNGLATRIYTNGALATVQYMLEIAPILTDIVLSMDSLDETDAVQLRGDEKCVAEAVSALDACKQAGVPVKVISVCASVNRQSLPELGEYLSSRGIEDWWIQQFIPQGRGRSLQGKYDMDSSLFEETVESLKATFAGTIRAFPAVGKNRHRVYVDCRGSFVEYDSGRELGRVLDPETRRAVFSDASYGNKRRS